MKKLVYFISIIVVPAALSANPNAITSGKAHYHGLDYYQDQLECEQLFYEKSEDSFIQYFQKEAALDIPDFENFCSKLSFDQELYDLEDSDEVESIGLGTYGNMIESFYRSFLKK